MNVEMPDGTVVTDVPDGTTQTELLRMLDAAKASERNRISPPDQSVLDANDARAKVQPPSPLDILRAKNRSHPLTRLLEGGWQPTMGLGQTLAHIASPVIGNKPAAFMDRQIDEYRAQQRKDMMLAGRDPDSPDIAGSIGAAINMAGMTPVKSSVGATGPMLPRPILSGAPTLGGRMAQGAAIGPISAATLPVENGQQNFGEQKAAQTILSTMLGFAAPPVVEGLVSAGGRGYNILRDLFRRQVTAPAQAQTASAAVTASGTPTATGTGGGSVFGNVGPDPSARLTRAQSALAQWWREQGGRMTPGQQSGSRALQQMEAKLESQPMTSGAFNTLKEHNQRVLNRIAARAIGENSDSLDFNVLGNAHERIGRVFRATANNNERPINQELFVDTVANLEREFEGLLPSPLANHPLVVRLLNLAANGRATNAQLQEIQSRLGKAALNEMASQNGNRQLGMALGDVQDLALDLLGEGLSRQQQAAFNTARQQWRALMQLTGRLHVVNPSTGNVSGVSLANLLQQKDRFGFLFGNNADDLYNAARFAQAFKPIVGDSGTATRSMIQSPTDFVLSLPFNLASRAYLTNPSISAVSAASGANQTGLGSAPFFGELLPSTPMAGLLAPVILPKPDQRRP